MSDSSGYFEGGIRGSGDRTRGSPYGDPMLESWTTKVHTKLVARIMAQSDAACAGVAKRHVSSYV